MAAVKRTRTGARTFLDIMRRACKLSHMPGFVTGLNLIIGETNGSALYNLWTPLCTLIESLIALDDVFNQVDASSQGDGGEDTLGI